jgi:hypothetical protein
LSCARGKYPTVGGATYQHRASRQCGKTHGTHSAVCGAKTWLRLDHFTYDGQSLLHTKATVSLSPWQYRNNDSRYQARSQGDCELGTEMDGRRFRRIVRPVDVGAQKPEIKMPNCTSDHKPCPGELRAVSSALGSSPATDATMMTRPGSIFVAFFSRRPAKLRWPLTNASSKPVGHDHETHPAVTRSERSPSAVN